jgi:hypothetical protein
VTLQDFKKCGICIAVDGTNDMLWNGSEEVGSVTIGWEENEGTGCEDGQSDTD